MAERISSEEIVRLAALSRIQLSPDEVKSLEHDLVSILTYVSELSSLGDAEGIDRYFNKNTLRTDTILQDEQGDQLVALAPQSKDNYVAVKQIITRRHDN